MISDSDTYKLSQMHFHWRGSEHQVDGKKFAGELHLVHQSLNESTKFAVLGFLIQVKLANPSLNKTS